MNLLPSFVGAPELNRVYHCDLFTLCDAMPAQSVDMILCDLPYGTTACHWDTVIPFEPMWARFKRIIKPRGAIVLTASQPFTSALVMSNPTWFRYEWIWRKPNPTGLYNAKFIPLKAHENVIVFSQAPSRSNQFTDFRMNYSPQGLRVDGTKQRGKSMDSISAVIDHKHNNVPASYIRTHSNYPTTDLYFPVERGFHPTQKPVPLFEYLIRTYTQPGELVFDGVCGSGTSGLAARNCGRQFIIGDKELEYVLTSRDRLRLPFEPKQREAVNDLSGLPLFAEATNTP